MAYGQSIDVPQLAQLPEVVGTDRDNLRPTVLSDIEMCHGMFQISP